MPDPSNKPHLCEMCSSDISGSHPNRKCCPACVREKRRVYEAALKKRRYRSDSAYRETVLKRNQKYSKKSRDKINARQRSKRAAEGSGWRYNVWRRKKYKNDPNFREMIRIGNASRHGLRKHIPTLAERDGPNCQHCGKRCADLIVGVWMAHGGTHVDHVIPRAKGGGEDVSNLQLLCASCNTSKRDRVIG